MPATFLVVTYGESGEVLPMLSIVQGLVRRGHRVLVCLGEKFKHGALAAGGEYVPPHHYKDPLTQLESLSQMGSNPLVRFLRMRDIRRTVLDSIPDLIRDLEGLIHRERVDCVLSGFLGMGVRYAAEHAGALHASVSPNPLLVFDMRGRTVMRSEPWIPLLPRSLERKVMNLLLPVDPIRASLGLPEEGDASLPQFLGSSLSRSLHIITVHREFVPVPDSTLRPGQVFVGPMSFDLPRSSAVPFPVESLAPGTVLVSATTTPLEPGVFARTLEAIAPMEVPVLATVGSASVVPRGLGGHVRLEPYVPHEQVLPHISALVTHGGWGIVGRALRHGVPMLITPLFGDQPLIAKRLAEQGLAYHLPVEKATRPAIREALTALLADLALHARVKAVSERFANMDSPALAAEVLERFVDSHGRLSRQVA